MILSPIPQKNNCDQLKGSAGPVLPFFSEKYLQIVTASLYFVGFTYSNLLFSSSTAFFACVNVL